MDIIKYMKQRSGMMTCRYFIGTLLLPGCLVLLSGSCGLLRKVEKESAESLQEQHSGIFEDSLSLVKQLSTSAFMQQQTDSVSSEYLLEIWPRGKFSLGANGRFEGEAEKISLRGHDLAKLKSFQLRQQDEAISSLNSLNKQNIRQEKSMQKQELVKKNPAWKWALILLAALILLYCLDLKSFRFLLKET